LTDVEKKNVMIPQAIEVPIAELDPGLSDVALEGFPLRGFNPNFVTPLLRMRIAREAAYRISPIINRHFSQSLAELFRFAFRMCSEICCLLENQTDESIVNDFLREWPLEGFEPGFTIPALLELREGDQSVHVTDLVNILNALAFPLDYVFGFRVFPLLSRLELERGLIPLPHLTYFDSLESDWHSLFLRMYQSLHFECFEILKSPEASIEPLSLDMHFNDIQIAPLDIVSRFVVFIGRGLCRMAASGLGIVLSQVLDTVLGSVWRNLGKVQDPLLGCWEIGINIWQDCSLGVLRGVFDSIMMQALGQALEKCVTSELVHSAVLARNDCDVLDVYIFFLRPFVLPVTRLFDFSCVERRESADLSSAVHFIELSNISQAEVQISPAVSKGLLTFLRRDAPVCLFADCEIAFALNLAWRSQELISIIPFLGSRRCSIASQNGMNIIENQIMNSMSRVLADCVLQIGFDKAILNKNDCDVLGMYDFVPVEFTLDSGTVSLSRYERISSYVAREDASVSYHGLELATTYRLSAVVGFMLSVFSARAHIGRLDENVLLDLTITEETVPKLEILPIIGLCRSRFMAQEMSIVIASQMNICFILQNFADFLDSAILTCDDSAILDVYDFVPQLWMCCFDFNYLSRFMSDSLFGIEEEKELTEARLSFASAEANFGDLLRPLMHDLIRFSPRQNSEPSNVSCNIPVELSLLPSFAHSLYILPSIGLNSSMAAVRDVIKTLDTKFHVSIFSLQIDLLQSENAVASKPDLDFVPYELSRHWEETLRFVLNSISAPDISFFASLFIVTCRALEGIDFALFFAMALKDMWRLVLSPEFDLICDYFPEVLITSIEQNLLLFDVDLDLCTFSDSSLFEKSASIQRFGVQRSSFCTAENMIEKDFFACFSVTFVEESIRPLKMIVQKVRLLKFSDVPSNLIVPETADILIQSLETVLLDSQGKSLEMLDCRLCLFDVAELALLSAMAVVNNGLNRALREGVILSAYCDSQRLLKPRDSEEFISISLGKAFGDVMCDAMNRNFEALELPQFFVFHERLRQMDSLLVPPGVHAGRGHPDGKDRQRGASPLASDFV
jgi:hypothetical protein